LTTRQNLTRVLPFGANNLTVRKWCRDDVERRAAWPPYPQLYSGFNSNLSTMTRSQRDTYFQERDQNPSRITLTVDHLGQPAVGLVALIDIDWAERTVGNMGVRLHPAWCDRGIGTTMMKLVTTGLFRGGIRCLRLDVAMPNVRALRCYEKAGFVAGEQFERDGGLFRWMALQNG
jgi:RimJ/RimL family protein N-acetyltransferase